MHADYLANFATLTPVWVISILALPEHTEGLKR